MSEKERGGEVKDKLDFANHQKKLRNRLRYVGEDKGVPPVREEKGVPPVAATLAVDFTGEDAIAFLIAVK